MSRGWHRLLHTRGVDFCIGFLTPSNCCRGWCELLCGRGCGFCAGPFRRYQEAFSAGRYIPTLQVSNYMNQEAIVQVMPCQLASSVLCGLTL